MNKQRLVTVCIFLVCFMVTTVPAQQWNLGIGLNTGLGRLEGDDPNSQLSPLISGHMKVLPIPYLAFTGELGYSSLKSNTPFDFRTQIIPFELSGMFNFLPFHKLNPYVFIGGGGVLWSAKSNAGTLEDGFDSFLKTGGGLEYRVNENIGINLGAAFRLSLTDAFDQLRFGDENDQVLDIHAGFTYYFNKRRNDLDHDNVPDDFDIMPDIAEDRDGYLDHDGIPEKNSNPKQFAMSSVPGNIGNSNNSQLPVVIHHLVENAESGKSLPVDAYVYSDMELKVVATLYRPVGTSNWNVIRMEEKSNRLYQTEIPGYAVTSDGLEYCVVAVDQNLTGIGYSGLPNKPIQVSVVKNGTPWRIIGGALGAAAIGSASYLIIRKQN